MSLDYILILEDKKQETQTIFQVAKIYTLLIFV